MSAAEDEEEKVSIPEFSIPIHSLIESSQTSHGLRHEDYKQYHGYCTRRLSRLRHNRAVKKELVHSAKFVADKKLPRKNAFCPRDRPEQVQHENHLLVVLFGAERAWAHSCEIKALEGNQRVGLTAQNEKARSSPGKIRQHALKRLKRAKQLATELEEVAKDSADERTLLEAQAYGGWMRGNWSLEVSSWKTAFEEYASAISICRKLSQGSAGDENSPENLELRDLFTARADNVLKPLLRYCQYELQHAGESVPDVPELAQETTQAGADNRKGDISFRGHDMSIENKSLRVLLLKVEGLVEDFRNNAKNEDKFLQLLTSYDDAINLVTADHKKYQSMKSGPAVDAKRFEMENLLGYVNFQKLKLLMGRNESLVKELRLSPEKDKDKKIEEIAHLYETLLQDARTVCNLPGGEGRAEDDFILEANANILRIRALRCYYAARLYFSLGKTKESEALSKQAELLRSRAVEEIAACEGMEHGDEYLEGLEALEEDITAATIRAQAAAYLSTRSTKPPGMMRTKRSLLQRLEDFDAGQDNRLADVPLDLIPMPCKPVFFDIAEKHLPDYPIEALQKHIDELNEQERKGKGYFSRLFGS